MRTMADLQRTRIKKAVSEPRNAESKISADTMFNKSVNLNMPFLNPNSYLSHIKRFQKIGPLNQSSFTAAEPSPVPLNSN